MAFFLYHTPGKSGAGWKELCKGLILAWTWDAVVLLGWGCSSSLWAQIWVPRLCTPSPAKHNSISIMFLLLIFVDIKGGFQSLLKLVGFLLLDLNVLRWGLKCLLHSATLMVPHDMQIPFLFLLVCPLWLKSHANCKNINHHVLFKPNRLSAAGRP